MFGVYGANPWLATNKESLTDQIEENMPYKPGRPCKVRLCPNVTTNRSGYCDMHKHLAPSMRSDNPYVSMYNSKWKQASRQYLKSHIVCSKCMSRATVVDHIIPHHGDVSLFWSHDNWQALCSKCHNTKTSGERNRLRS